MVAGAAAALLVSDLKGMNIPDIAGGKAPDAVAAPGAIGVGIFLI